MKYVRFTVLSKWGNQALDDGIFTSAYELRGGDGLSALDRQHLEELLAWFRNNLTIPARFNKAGGKRWNRDDPRGLSWFKLSAVEHLAKIRELAALVECYGYIVQQCVEAKIGYIVFEDKHQVVAEPFADSRS